MQKVSSPTCGRRLAKEPFSFNRECAAFTLAEVLITLGVIGIVAAMTLPALVGRYQEKAKVTQLKKVYSILSQAYEKSVYDSGSEPKDWGMGGMYEAESHIIMANHFVPYLKLIQNCVGQSQSYTKKHCSIQNASYTHPNNYTSVRLADGTTVIFRVWSGQCTGKRGSSKHLQTVCGTIIVDLNGDKNPNIRGQDEFVFYMTNYGPYPVGSQLDTSLSFSQYCTKDKKWGANYNGYYNGTGCTAWVLYNENMDYLRCTDLDWNGKKKCD